MVFRRLSESSNVFKSTTCETLFLRDKEQFGHHGGGQGSYLYAQTLRVHGAHIAELHSCKAPGSDSFQGRVQSVVCMCVCVCFAGCAWDTEEHSFWGSRKGRRQGRRVGVHACGARKQ